MRNLTPIAPSFHMLLPRFNYSQTCLSAAPVIRSIQLRPLSIKGVNDTFILIYLYFPTLHLIQIRICLGDLSLYVPPEYPAQKEPKFGWHVLF